MLHIPRFARLLMVALLLVALPTMYFFYPGPGLPSTIHHEGLDQGGIDSEHLRPPVEPHAGKPVIEDEEPRDNDQWGAAAQDLAKAEEIGDAAGSSAAPQVHDSTHDGAVSSVDDVLSGGVIMGKLGNETAKAELGRAAWRVLHLMTLRFPDKPTEDDRNALKSFFHLFSRLYPCGECAVHFQKMLKKYPPQTSSRKSASLWLCHVHNVINERLHKPEFDCLTLDKTYDCGCGNETSIAGGSVALPTAPIDHGRGREAPRPGLVNP